MKVFRANVEFLFRKPLHNVLEATMLTIVAAISRGP
jgi:hypothetical protein